MHTFEVSCRIDGCTYRYLSNHLPHLKRVSDYVERTNFYAAKGFSQIELREYPYQKYGVILKQYYLVFRCNPATVMGDSKLLLVDLERYSLAEIQERLKERLYEVNEFRYTRIYTLPMSIFLANRIDVAQDIIVERPDIVVWLANMSFRGRYRMERLPINKEPDILYFESCCFFNKSRRLNFYNKRAEIVNNGRMVSPEEKQVLYTVRAEIQIEKKGLYGLPTKRSIEPFLEHDFCQEYLLKEIQSMFGIQRYVCRAKAVESIQNSQNTPYERAVMLSIVDAIQRYSGLYGLERAIEDENTLTPIQYGDLQTFKNKWLKKFAKLGIQPAAIPDSFGIDEMPSIYELLLKGDVSHE